MNNSKLYNILLTIILLLCLFFWNKTNNQKDQFKKLSTLYMDKYHETFLNVIAEKEKQIKFLEFKIINNKKLIDQSKQKLDSLSRLKNKVNVIYVNKVKEINDFNSNQLENYFNEELN